MSETWRCFIAVPIPEKLRDGLAAMTAALRDDPAVEDLRWTAPPGWHLTLAFLGATPSEEVGRIAGVMRDVTRGLEAFTLPAGGLGAFPAPREARVFWFGVEDREGRLRTLASRIHEALGLEAPRRFRAHLTLARSRQRLGGPNLVDWLATASSPEGEIRVDRLVLFRSHLGRGPAEYEPLAEVALTPPAMEHV